MQHQQAVIEQQGLARVVALENEALPAVVAMELAGVQVDTEHWRKVLINKCARLAQLQEQIQQVLGEALVEKQACAQQSLFDGKPVQAHVSLSSNEQLKDSLHALGIKVTSTNAVTLAAMKDAHPVVPLIQEWKKLQKFVSSFGETFLEHVGSDNRIHATFDQLGADSGRFSCYRPNLQQIPKEKDPDADIRRCFIARPGYTLLIADLSNIELRICTQRQHASCFIFHQRSIRRSITSMG
ncbi:MAG: hypothetical protein E6J34_00315 [Chloroflexi bacterium]|nr:MAG: hypothetical protein E6J34_00315 [Chloroflexota bacterium]